MWKYKLACPFGGYGEAVLILAMLSMFLGVPLGVLAEIKGASADLTALCFVLPMLPILTVSFCMAHHRSAEDRQKIRSASPLCWEPAGDLPESGRMQDEFFRYGIFLFCLGIFILASLTSKMFELLMPEGILFVIVLLIAWHEIRFWSHPDETAETALLPVDHYYCTYSLNTEKGSRRYLDKYAILVCYLPDGKYRFKLKTDEPPAFVRLVRYKKRFRIWM